MLKSTLPSARATGGALSRAALAWAAASTSLISCGGGGGDLINGQSTAEPSISVTWAARSRAVNAPASALSGVVTLANANPQGGDFVFGFNRSDAPGQYTQTYRPGSRCLSGKTTVTVKFYAQHGAMGAVVASAEEMVTIGVDGSGLNAVTLANAVTQVLVANGQTVGVGASQLLVCTPEDESGNAVAVTPGSVFWAVVSGGSLLTLTQSGTSTGVSPGTATVTATVDGNVSAASAVLVTPKAIRSFSIQAIKGAGAEANATAYPTGINNNGDVVGCFYTHGSVIQHAFLMKGGAFTAIPPTPGNTSSVATGVNDSDLVVGWSTSSPFIAINIYDMSGFDDDVGNLVPTGTFAWQNGQFTFVEISGVTSGWAAVNQSGQFVRNVLHDHSSVPVNPVLRTGGIDQPLQQPPPGYGVYYGAAQGINDSGEVCGVGNTLSAADSEYSVYWQNLLIHTIPVGYGAEAINNIGHVVVFGGNGTYIGDALLTNGASQIAVVQEIPAMLAINNLDQVVGTSNGGGARIWQSGKTTDLNAMIPANSGWTLTAATGINDKGQVIGYGMLKGTLTGFLLTPTG